MMDILFEILLNVPSIPIQVGEINHFECKTCEYLNDLRNLNEMTTGIPIN